MSPTRRLFPEQELSAVALASRAQETPRKQHGHTTKVEGQREAQKDALLMRDLSCMVSSCSDIPARSFSGETDPVEPGHVSIESPIVTFPFAQRKASRMACRGKAKRCRGERTAVIFSFVLRSCSKQQREQTFLQKKDAGAKWRALLGSGPASAPSMS